ncbi:MAG: hypothetical protein CO118_09045 [Flavobacteriales bacterium CG_4_9_14_3_um_filter_32_8]|nr:MAG: hypothetical protein CO118_09045 [Flavobacteriales bacterium CG_4_9_14_3_um_filter_32_8]
MKTKLTILLLLLFSFQIGKSQFAINFSANQTWICLGDTTTFTSYSSPTIATSWYWDFGDGDTSNIQNPIHAYNSPGSYDVTLIASDGIDTDSLTKPFFINVDSLIVDFTFNINIDTVNFYDQSFPAYLWDWNFGDGNTSMLANPMHIYDLPPDSCYSVTLLVTHPQNCKDSITKLICITSIEELNVKNINIYPSPIINNQFKIKGEVQGLIGVVAYDILGNEVKIPILFKSENEITLATNQLKKGSYFIKLLFENGAPITKTIVVQ